MKRTWSNNLVKAEVLRGAPGPGHVGGTVLPTVRSYQDGYLAGLRSAHQRCEEGHTLANQEARETWNARLHLRVMEAVVLVLVTSTLWCAVLAP